MFYLTQDDISQAITNILLKVVILLEHNKIFHQPALDLMPLIFKRPITEKFRSVLYHFK